MPCDLFKHTPGSKCCGVCVVCEEMESLSSWSIDETILGFAMAGSFGALNETSCTREGQDCKREDNIDSGHEHLEVSGWFPWGEILRCGECVNCDDPGDPLGLPPCPDDIFTGGVNCPPGYPTYKTIERSTQNGMRVKFWYSKAVKVKVFVFHPSPTTVRFQISVSYITNQTETVAFATMRRWRRTEYLCTYDTIISRTVYNDGTFGVPEPIEPCEDILGPFVFPFVDCPAFEPPEVPEDCDSETNETITESGCVYVLAGECVTTTVSTTITTLDLRACCDVGTLCPTGFEGIQQETLSYHSATFNCDEVPAAIECEIQFTGGTAHEFEIAWGPCASGIELPEPIPFVIPDVLTLRVL